MAELSHDMQRLLAEARAAHDPDDAAQQRVRAALAATLATGVATGAAVATLNAGGAATGASGLGATGSVTKVALVSKLLAAKASIIAGASVVVVSASVWVASQNDPAVTPPAEVPTSSAHGPASAPAASARVGVPPSGDVVGVTAEGPALPHPSLSAGASPPAPVLEEAGRHAERAPAAPVSAPPGAAEPAARPMRTASRPSARRPVTREHGATSSVATPHASASAQPQVTLSAPPAIGASANDLSGEMRLMRRATSAISAGHYEAALGFLAKHASSYPGGSLSEERRGLRAVSLCKLGRPSGADAAHSFAGQYPTSPLLARVRAACEDPR